MGPVTERKTFSTGTKKPSINGLAVNPTNKAYSQNPQKGQIGVKSDVHRDQTDSQGTRNKKTKRPAKSSTQMRLLHLIPGNKGGKKGDSLQKGKGVVVVRTAWGTSLPGLSDPRERKTG